MPLSARTMLGLASTASILLDALSVLGTQNSLPTASSACLVLLTLPIRINSCVQALRKQGERIGLSEISSELSVLLALWL